MKSLTILDHEALNRLLPLLPDDPERERLASASDEANAAAAGHAATIAAQTARAAAIERRIVAGVTNATERNKLLTERQQLATELLFAPGILDVAVRARVLAELAYLAHLYRAASAAEQAAQAAYAAADLVWSRPAGEAEELRNHTMRERDERRAALAAQLVPLAATKNAAAATLTRLHLFRQICDALAPRFHGDGVNLLHPDTWRTAAEEAARRATAPWRPPVAA